MARKSTMMKKTSRLTDESKSLTPATRRVSHRKVILKKWCFLAYSEKVEGKEKI